jgi:hypothetical protein
MASTAETESEKEERYLVYNEVGDLDVWNLIKKRRCKVGWRK